MTKQPKRPHDPNQLAKAIVEAATGPKHAMPEADTVEEKDPAAVALGRKGGLKGGRARADKMSAERRSEIAKRAAEARWSSKGENNG